MSTDRTKSGGSEVCIVRGDNIGYGRGGNMGPIMLVY